MATSTLPVWQSLRWLTLLDIFSSNPTPTQQAEVTVRRLSAEGSFFVKNYDVLAEEAPSHGFTFSVAVVGPEDRNQTLIASLLKQQRVESKSGDEEEGDAVVYHHVPIAVVHEEREKFLARSFTPPDRESIDIQVIQQETIAACTEIVTKLQLLEQEQLDSYVKGNTATFHPSPDKEEETGVSSVHVLRDVHRAVYDTVGCVASALVFPNIQCAPLLHYSLMGAVVRELRRKSQGQQSAQNRPVSWPNHFLEISYLWARQWKKNVEDWDYVSQSCHAFDQVREEVEGEGCRYSYLDAVRLRLQFVKSEHFDASTTQPIVIPPLQSLQDKFEEE